MPVHNAENWLDAALKSVLDQSWKDSLQVSIYNDASTVIMSFFKLFILQMHSLTSHYMH